MSAQTYENGTLVESWDDTSRTYTDHRTDPPTTRPYTAEENAAADQRLTDASRLDDHEARLYAIEAHLWPAHDDPEPGTPIDAPTWGELDPPGWWRPGTLLADAGTTWKNVSGSVLTTPPSGFPGDPDAWSHLFVAVTTPDPEPDPEPDPDPEPGHPDGYVGPWDKDATYKVGDVVDRDGTYYRSRIAHGAEYQGTWGPPQASVWTDLGPTT